MRQSITQPLERHTDITGPFETEPFECAWAGEALFFVRVQEQEGQNAVLNARVQISPDGIHWVDEGTRFDPMTEPSLKFVRVAHFGGWLRLVGEASGAGARFNVMIHLVLKE